MVWQGLFELVAFANSQGTVRQGKAMQRLVRSGTARHGEDPSGLVAVPLIVKVRRDWVWLGRVMLG
jgi:hypothetical protein